MHATNTSCVTRGVTLSEKEGGVRESDGRKSSLHPPVGSSVHPFVCLCPSSPFAAWSPRTTTSFPKRTHVQPVRRQQQSHRLSPPRVGHVSSLTSSGRGSAVSTIVFVRISARKDRSSSRFVSLPFTSNQDSCLLYPQTAAITNRQRMRRRESEKKRPESTSQVVYVPSSDEPPHSLFLPKVGFYCRDAGRNILLLLLNRMRLNQQMEMSSGRR